jgi:hypothetical protein
MRSTEQLHIQLLEALSQLTKLRPDWRLGQTVANLAMTAGRMNAGGVWDLEDDEALLAARTLIAEYSQIDSNVTSTGAVSDGNRRTDSASHSALAGDDGR